MNDTNLPALNEPALVETPLALLVPVEEGGNPLTELRDQVAANFLQGISAVVGGASQDLNVYGVTMANDMVLAAATGNEALTAEIGNQAKTLLEINRIRVHAESLQFIVNTALAVTGTLTSLVARIPTVPAA